MGVGEWVTPPLMSAGGLPAKKATDSIWKLGSSSNFLTVFFLLIEQYKYNIKNI